jgi:hypothetical protein
LVSVLLPTLAFAQVFTRPSSEVRTINTATYAFNVQKNGRVDVEHVAYGVIMENAFPMVRFADEEDPELLRLKGLASARTPVKDRLGEGQGFQFTGKDAVWLLRSYPTQPFFTVQLIYKNEGRKPVSVAALYPWVIGDPKRGRVTLGAGTANAPILTADPPQVVRGNAESGWNLAGHNPLSGRNLVAGFLTQNDGMGALTLGRSEDAPDEAWDRFRAASVFDPPRVVAPGEQLASEVLYVSIADTDVIQGLRRYGKAVGVWNGIHDSRPPLPHGWKPATTPDLETLRREREAQGEDLKAFGWTHLNTGYTWRAGDGGSSEAWSQFLEESRAKGFSTGIAVAPFDGVDRSDAAQVMEIENVLRGMQRSVPFEAVRVVEAEVTKAGPSDATTGPTYLGMEQAGLAAVRTALPGKFITATAGSAASGRYLDARRVGDHSPTSWADVVALLTSAARQFYLTPHCYVPALPPVDLGAESALTEAQQQAWLTATALLGGPVTFGTPPSALGETQRGWLTKLLPSMQRPARPLDLFQDGPPQVWHLPLEGSAGDSHVLALFNWDPDKVTYLPLNLAELGVGPAQYMTVFDFWGASYLGTAQGTLDVEIAPGSVRLLGLRPYEGRPMLIATDRHFTQGATYHLEVTWNAGTGTLRGTFTGVAGVPVKLWILQPAGYGITGMWVAGEEVPYEAAETAVVVTVTPEETGAVSWEAVFAGR